MTDATSPSPQPTPAAGDDIVTAALIVIGDEILSGRTKDRNIGHVAETLTSVGIQLSEVRVVSDEEDRIVEAVNDLRARCTYVFTTGGIGPTHDDITADSIAAAFGVGIDVDPRAVAVMEPYYRGKGMKLEGPRLRMARIPHGGELITNNVSGAPGFMVDNVIVMAGIPDIMQSMLASVLPGLRKGPQIQSVTLEMAHPESSVSEILRAAQAQFADVPMGSYPFVRDGQYCTNLVLRCADEARLAEAVDLLVRDLSAANLQFSRG